MRASQSALLGGQVTSMSHKPFSLCEQRLGFLQADLEESGFDSSPNLVFLETQSFFHIFTQNSDYAPRVSFFFNLILFSLLGILSVPCTCECCLTSFAFWVCELTRCRW